MNTYPFVAACNKIADKAVRESVVRAFLMWAKGKIDPDLVLQSCGLPTRQRELFE